MGKGKILIVDDSPLVRKLAEVSLQEAGYEVYTADNGEDGLKIAQSINPDLILVDFIMPKMTGSQFCMLLKEQEQLKDTPIILITGKGETVGQAFIEKYGVYDYFIKPFKSEDLVEKVDLILSKISPILEEQIEVETPQYEEILKEEVSEEKIPVFEESVFEIQIPSQEEILMPEVEIPPLEELSKQEEVPSQEEFILSSQEFDELLSEKIEFSEEMTTSEISELKEEVPSIEIPFEESETLTFDEKEEAILQTSKEISDIIATEEKIETSERLTDVIPQPSFDIKEMEKLIEAKLNNFTQEILFAINYSMEALFKKYKLFQESNFILSGTLKGLDLRALFNILSNSKMTGLLTIECDKIIYEFMLLRGQIIYAISNYRRAKLGGRILKDLTEEEIKNITHETISELLSKEIKHFILEESYNIEFIFRKFA
ncbi:response regulator receiver protein [Thermodesulfovibrio sp. N1]|uniref:response regulator n=1 Tax=Thermodesulfovibrio sp. N1 TaxID=1871110 RepID=UPI00083AF20B|nr:response regulator [Thermodesulfovibrio sp. N1]ODA43642.1 response regulator receiver protein [Thermodesulfovibrio sp. N1]